MLANRLARALGAAALFLLSVSCFLLAAPRGPLQFEPAQLPAAQVGVAYDARVTISDNATPAGQFSVSEGALPMGLALERIPGEPNAAHIFGTPEEAGTFTFRIFVWCYGTNVSGQTGEKQYSLVVQ
ncbi:MAG TPA: putative Ig domain-containing protein [Anaerolineales bacterium]